MQVVVPMTLWEGEGLCTLSLYDVCDLSLTAKPHRFKYMKLEAVAVIRVQSPIANELRIQESQWQTEAAPCRELHFANRCILSISSLCSMRAVNSSQVPPRNGEYKLKNKYSWNLSASKTESIPSLFQRLSWEILSRCCGCESLHTAGNQQGKLVTLC